MDSERRSLSSTSSNEHNTNNDVIIQIIECSEEGQTTPLEHNNSVIEIRDEENADNSYIENDETGKKQRKRNREDKSE